MALHNLSPTLDNFYWLDQIQPLHRRFVGDQAFYLGLLAQRGYPVLPGLVISASAFQKFLETVDWLEPLFADFPHSSLHLNVDNPRQLQSIAQQIRQTIQTATLPDEWIDKIVTIAQTWNRSTLILRPSLTVQPGVDPTLSSKTVGLLEPQICWAEAGAVTHSLKQLWAELFRAKSLLYWQRSGIQLQQLNLAVLVQPLERAIASGEVQVGGTGQEIRAAWGVNQALFKGEVATDLYQIHRQTETLQRVSRKTHAYQVAVAEERTAAPAKNCLQPYVVEPKQQQQSVLNLAQLQQIAQLSRQVAIDLSPRLYLEWTIDDNSKLWLTQVMPQLTEPLPSLGGTENHTSALRRPPLQTPLEISLQIDRDTVSAALLARGLAAASGKATAPAWVISSEIPSRSNIPSGMILVAASIAPDWLSDVKQAAGLITEQGGMTSHGALLSRELGIPAVVGAANTTRLIQTGDLVLLDGDRGEIYRLDRSAAYAPSSPVLPRSFSKLPDKSSDKLPDSRNATQLMVNLSQTDRLSQVANLPIDGVGLLRSELMLMEVLAQHPYLDSAEQQRVLSDRIAQQICQFAQAFHPRPVFYRSLDLRSHEHRSIEPDRAQFEKNPILGLHGAFSYQVNPTLFRVELAALRQVQQSGYDNVHLILPFVRTVEEFCFCRSQAMQAGLLQPHFQLWIMAEVPSVLFLLPDYVKAGAQGISIGSNDLTQLLLGVDRDHPQMAAAYDQRHPAVLQAIQQLVETARRENIPCSICGQAPSQYPDLISDLVRWGITSISVDPDALAQTKEAIDRAERAMSSDSFATPEAEQ